jgi:HEAT repeat protein
MRFRRFFVLGLVLCACSRPALAAPPRASDVPPLVQKLQYGDAKMRAEAAKELGEIGLVKVSFAKPAIPILLLRAQRDQDAKVREAALLALGRVEADPKQAMPVFLAALQDPEDPVKIAAAEGMSHLGGDAQEAMPELERFRAEFNKMDRKEQDKHRGVQQAYDRAIQAIRSSPKKKK